MMDFIKKLKSMLKLSERRLEQLERKSDFYKEMELHKDECSDVIMQFMMNQSNIHLRQSKKLYNRSLLRFVSTTNENMNEVDELYEKKMTLIKQLDFCEGLKKFMLYQEEILNSNSPRPPC